MRAAPRLEPETELVEMSILATVAPPTASINSLAPPATGRRNTRTAPAAGSRRRGRRGWKSPSADLVPRGARRREMKGVEQALSQPMAMDSSAAEATEGWQLLGGGMNMRAAREGGARMGGAGLRVNSLG